MYVVFANGNGFMMAYTYSVKHMGSKYPDGGFAEIPVEMALEAIKEGGLFSYTKIDKDALEKAKERKRYVRPIVGELIYEETYKGWNNQITINKYGYVVERYKNGKHKAKQRHYYHRNGNTDSDAVSYDHTVGIAAVVEAYEEMNKKGKQDPNTAKRKIISQSADFDKLIETLKMEMAVEAL